MESSIITSVVILSVALTLFGISYYYFTTRHRERMAILEKGLDPCMFRREGVRLSFLLVQGFVCIGIALGILAGVIVSTSDWSLLNHEGIKHFIFPFTINLFLGLSLLLSYFVLKYKRILK
jgi:hypothetical protein